MTSRVMRQLASRPVARVTDSATIEGTCSVRNKTSCLTRTKMSGLARNKTSRLACTKMSRLACTKMSRLACTKMLRLAFTKISCLMCVPGTLFLGLVLVLALAIPAAASERLGTDVIPKFQQVHLVLDADREDYSGSVTVDLDVLRATSEVRLHSLGPQLQSLLLRDSQGVVGEWRESQGDHPSLSFVVDDTGVLTLTLPRALVTGPGRLEIEFVNEFDTQAASLYRVTIDGDGYVFSQLEAVDAREAFPCWDEPLFKIPYQLTLTVPEAHIAVSNTPPETETVLAGMRSTRFRRTPPLPSYLLAIATGPLETVPIDGLAIPGRVVTVRGRSALARDAVARTAPMLRALEAYFGRPYPFEKLDLIAVPEFWYGAMENAGAIVFAESAILYDPKKSGVRERRRLDSLLAHELAHMWFGDLVTMAWWDDLWLNESFANWMGEKMMQQLYPEYRPTLAGLEGRESAMKLDAQPAVRAIRKPVDPDVNLAQLADALAYDKGQTMLSMIEGWIEPEAFRSGVLGYLDRYAWKNASASDLWNALSDAAGHDLSPMMASFLDQPGVPLVTVERLDGGKVRVTQQRYRTADAAGQTSRSESAHPAQPSQGDERTWYVPLALRYPTSPEPGAPTAIHRLMLDQMETTVQLPLEARPAWIHPNADETGYYRWSVDKESLQLLVEGSTEFLGTADRVGLVYNLTALLMAGRVPGDQYLDLLSRCADDPEPEVVKAVLSSLEEVKDAFASSDLDEPFGAYVRHALAPAKTRFGLLPRSGELIAVTLLRQDLLWWLGNDGGDDEVLALGDSLATLYLEDPASCEPTVAESALRLAALRGDLDLFERYRERFETSKDPQDRRRFIAALGSFREPAVVERAVRYAVEGPLRPNERNTIGERMREEPDLQERLFTWMMETYDEVAALIPPDKMAYAPRYARGCSEDRLERARQFFADPAHQPVGTDVELAKVTDRVNACVALQEREIEAVSSYLRERL